MGSLLFAGDYIDLLVLRLARPINSRPSETLCYSLLGRQYNFARLDNVPGWSTETVGKDVGEAASSLDTYLRHVTYFHTFPVHRTST